MKKDALAIRKKQGLVKRGHVRSWKTVSYVLAVKNIRVSALPGANPMRQVVVGRALGDRKDGQCFFVEMDIPWIVPAKWNWQKTAKLRLESYLDEKCSCASNGAEAKVCEFHEVLTQNWRDFDDQMEGVSRDVAKTAHLTQRHQGAVIPLRVLHWDFPWCRHDVDGNRIVCEICGFFEEPFPENSSYMNVFIRKHSACGFPDSGYLKSMAECNLVYYGDGARVVDEMMKKGEQEHAELAAIREMSRGRSGDMLPERMRPDEFLKFMREKVVKVTA